MCPFQYQDAYYGAVRAPDADSAAAAAVAEERGAVQHVGLDVLLERYAEYLAGVLGGTKSPVIVQRRLRAVSV